MARAPDNPTVPIALACELADVTRQVRTTWIERNLIVGSTKGTCDRAAVVDVACFSALVRILGFVDARLAWPQVADQVRALTKGRTDVVVDLNLKVATLATTLAEVGKACETGRLTRVIALRPVLDEVGIAFDRAAEILAATSRSGGT
jgi:hypothetical protein